MLLYCIVLHSIEYTNAVCQQPSDYLMWFQAERTLVVFSRHIHQRIRCSVDCTFLIQCMLWMLCSALCTYTPSIYTWAHARVILSIWNMHSSIRACESVFKSITHTHTRWDTTLYPFAIQSLDSSIFLAFIIHSLFTLRSSLVDMLNGEPQYTVHMPFWLENESNRQAKGGEPKWIRYDENSI